jgi:hypothetical protein
MTTLISWVGYHASFASAYVASDSRVSWYQDGNRRWDAGKKVFACRLQPDVFGYAGDVIFPALALSQIADALDLGLLLPTDASPWEKHEAIKCALKDSYSLRHHADDQDFWILHISRSGQGDAVAPHAWVLEYSASSARWTDFSLPVPDQSGIVCRLGSGAAAAQAHQRRWAGDGGYSREIFSSFCDAICSDDDPLSGGAPQLAGIYRIGPARTFGVALDGSSYFEGLPVPRTAGATEIEWRDRLLQRVDTLGLLLADAQPHARPKHLKSN